MDDCIVNVCLSIGQETRGLIEGIVLRYKNVSERNYRFLIAAILLGSTKVAEKFRQCFEETFANGVKHYSDYRVNELLNFLETISFLHLDFMQDLVGKLVLMRDEQGHRARNHVLWSISKMLMPERYKRKLNYLDSEPIKLAEAVNVYLTNGTDGLKDYLNTKTDSEYRASNYLFCLACDRNPDDYEYFLQQYNFYNDPLVKKVCIEGVIYTSDSSKAAAFLDEELGRYDLQHLIEKVGHDFKIITVRAHELLFYFLLIACYYLKTLNEGLINKLKILSNARESTTSTYAMVILQKFGMVLFDENMINSNQELLLKTLPSPAHLLSMAKSFGKL